MSSIAAVPSPASLTPLMAVSISASVTTTSVAVATVRTHQNNINNKTHNNTVDTRNLQWKSNNVGSKLLQKMGWKEGQGIGKRRRQTLLDGGSGDGPVEHDNNNDKKDTAAMVVSTEGLKVQRRRDGLGLGATATTMTTASLTHAVTDLSNVLAELNQHHPPAGRPNDNDDDDDDSKERRKAKKKKKKSTKKSKEMMTTAAVVSFATNKSTHAKVRQAKFQPRSTQEYHAIFAGAADHALTSFTATVASKHGQATTTTNDDNDKDAVQNTKTSRKSSSKRKRPKDSSENNQESGSGQEKKKDKKKKRKKSSDEL